MFQTNARDSKADLNEGFTRQGSLRRVLPSEHNKENLFGRQNEDLNKLNKAFHQEYVILAEYKMIQSENFQGIYIIPSKESSLLWFGVVFVRSGPFEHGVFRFNIHLDENFPDCKHPRVVFQSKLCHPVIDERTDELNLLGGFPVWLKGEQHLWQVVKYIHWALHNVNSSLPHAVNSTAVDLHRDNHNAFLEQAKHCVQFSKEHLYDVPPVDDKHYIVFEQYTPNIHDPVRASMLHQNNGERILTSGHSWVKDGTFEPLTREPSNNSESES